jgi:serine/threonine-protein kinase
MVQGNIMNSDRWSQLCEHFDAALALPRNERAAFVERVSANDPELRRELTSLLAASDAAPEFLERPPELPGAPPGSGTLEPEQRLGPWRVRRLIGRGGMGEVYEVARSDGQFEQRAALKLTHHDTARFQDRFNAERQILARLDHPGIARLLDGGITPDGRPYAVMEFVEGELITRYCEMAGAGLAERIGLFLQVCDAVSHAHGHLIIHRDIKPGNVLVDLAGRARLLDFGIAKPLDTSVDAASAEMTAALLTPDYAAPEQLTGEPVTTATDVYALGILLFELLTGSRPRNLHGQPLANMVRSVLDADLPLASVAAAQARQTPVAPRELEGDLDAIIAKCVRREPRQRYATVNALKVDVERSMRGDPVQARADAGWYVFGRLLRRYRWATAAVATIILLLGAGIVVTTWQAGRATREANRAAVTRDFLISIFRESDPRIARERAPGEITAKELLDQSVERIGIEFADDPETQLQLLGVASEIYGFWADEQRFDALIEQRKELARKHFGPTHPAYIESVTTDAWAAIYAQDYAGARQRLQEADRLIREGGHDASLLRAQWWLAKGESLKAGDRAERMAALDRAVALYARLAPQSADYAIALANSAAVRFVREDYPGAAERYQRAIRVFSSSKDRNDGDLASTYGNLARSLQNLGDFDAAERAWQQCHALYRGMHSQENASWYWHLAAEHARFVHMRGERERAQQLFAGILELFPADWEADTQNVIAREYHAERLAAEGRAAEAVPFLEIAEAIYLERPLREYDLRRVRQTLGDAYDRVGRTDDARRALVAARAERMEKDAADSIAVLGARERWARFLLDHGDLPGATRELAEILRLGGNTAIAPLALAHSDLARLAMLKNDVAGSVAESGRALEILDRVKGLYDVRLGPSIWRIHAAALSLKGDAGGAATWNLRALEASRRFDAPASVSTAL